MQARCGYRDRALYEADDYQNLMKPKGKTRMIKRTLGQGLEVSALSLGAMGYLGQGRVIADRPEMIALLFTAVERGMDFFDTAKRYGPFVNEEIVGEALEPFAIRSKAGPSLAQTSIPILARISPGSTASRTTSREPWKGVSGV
jgi:hypothetical protein